MLRNISVKDEWTAKLSLYCQTVNIIDLLVETQLFILFTELCGLTVTQ